jgi:outer membrane protein OmpA-like peptidoglycan-associated protein
MKHLFLAAVLLAGTAPVGAAPESAMSQVETDAIASSIAAEPAAVVDADCDPPMRDGKCGNVSDNRQMVFGAPAKTAVARSAPARAMNLAINFVVGSAQLTETSKQSLDRLASSFRKLGTSVSFFIDGHTDRSGTCEANLKLSQDRAAAAVEYLSTVGIDRSRMTPRGFGYQALKSPSNPTSSVNRRVEIVRNSAAGSFKEPSC